MGAELILHRSIGPGSLFAAAALLGTAWGLTHGLGWSQYTEALVGMGSADQAMLGAVTMGLWLLWVIAGPPLVIGGLIWLLWEWWIGADSVTM